MGFAVNSSPSSDCQSAETIIRIRASTLLKSLQFLFVFLFVL